MYRSFLFLFFTIITGRALRRLSMRTACTYAGYMQRRKRILWPEGSSQLSNYLARKKEEGDSRNVCYWPCLLQVLSSNRLCRRFSLLPFFLFFFPFFLFFSFSPFSSRPPKPKPAVFSPEMALTVSSYNLQSDRLASFMPGRLTAHCLTHTLFNNDRLHGSIQGKRLCRTVREQTNDFPEGRSSKKFLTERGTRWNFDFLLIDKEALAISKCLYIYIYIHTFFYSLFVVSQHKM